MQTFLPYPEFTLSARCLDRQRLGKQRVEVLQILRTLSGASSGWSNHPAVQMWRGHVATLVAYGEVICYEWLSRGYRDTCLGKIQALRFGSSEPPAWLGQPDFHLSHQSNLIRKLPEHYRPMFPGVPDDLSYIWPVGSVG